MLPYFTERFGNPSSRYHGFGEEAHAAVETARAEVASLIGAEAKEIVFTSGATESNGLALRGLARSLSSRGRHLVTTTIEHPSVLEVCRSLEGEGFEVTRIGVGAEGVVSSDEIAAALRPDTILVSLMAANNEVGTLQPVAEVGALCRARGIVLHSDAVQAAGRMPIDVHGWEVDAMSLSAHKMHGPKGVGALFLSARRKPRLRPEPQMLGGGQERGVRSGTHNVPGIVGFGVAARLAAEALAGGEAQRLAGLRDRLLEGLREIGGLTVNGSLDHRLPGNLNVSIERAEAETLILAMGGAIAISSGAACAEAGGKGSHVLRAMGLPDERIYTALRFGLGRYNSAAEIDRVVLAVKEAVTVARARSSTAQPRDRHTQ